MADLSTGIIALADYVSISKENKLTIAGIFDRFFVEKVPTNWPNMSLVVVFRGKPDSDHKIKLKIVNEQGEKILEQEFPLKIGNNGKVNFVTNLQNFPLKSFGEYNIALLEGDKTIGKVIFSVNRRKKKQDGLVS